ncbi:hypothetical protein Ancab_018918 [Ancistrocladus abbreviatus]
MRRERVGTAKDKDPGGDVGFRFNSLANFIKRLCQKAMDCKRPRLWPSFGRDGQKGGRRGGERRSGGIFWGRRGWWLLGLGFREEEGGGKGEKFFIFYFVML